MLQVNDHWRGEPPAQGGKWHHYPDGYRNDGPDHQPVDVYEVVTHFIVNGVTRNTTRVHHLHCLECGAMT